MSTNSQLEDKLQKFLEDNYCTIQYEILFPRYNELPEEVLLALSVIKKHGMKFVVKLEHTNNVSK